MDFSRLHLYTPPQCVPENTGYTYALSSSYSSDALDFETQHKLDPVFDSPRMSRRSLRLATSACASGDSQAGDAAAHASSSASLRDRAARTAKQFRSMNKETFSLNHISRKVVYSVSQTGSSGRHGRASVCPPVLDESLIREQTKVDHFWGLDDDGDLKGGNKAASHGNGDLAAGATTAQSNGYTCRDCSLLSERRDTLTARSLALGPISRVYSRDRGQKRGVSFCVDRMLWLTKYASSVLPSLLAQLFRVVLMKLTYDSDNDKLKTYESEWFKSKSHESKAGSGHCGRMNVAESVGEQSHLSGNGQSLCDDCKGETRRETRWAVHRLLSWPSHTMGALGCALSRTGKAASGIFWWLGIGWYQFVTLISWLNVFLLTRCLRNLCRVLILLFPLLLLIGVGLSLWGHSGILPFMPVLDWTGGQQVWSSEDPGKVFMPDSSPEDGAGVSGWQRVSDLERQVTSLGSQCHSHGQQLQELAAQLRELQKLQVEQKDGLSLGPHVRGTVSHGLDPQVDFMTFHQEHGVRISNLEDALWKLTEQSEAVQKELEQTRQRASRGTVEDQHLLLVVQHLELELGHLKAQLSEWQNVKTGCEQGDTLQERVDARVRETIRLVFSEDWQDGSLQWLLRKLSSQFVSKDDLQALLRDIEMQILSNVTHHISVTKQTLTSETVASAMSEAGVSGITEAQARVIVDNALKLYSQDKTGMVDFALESGGGSILSTRCSETYETKTALISLFGIPLWYFSQSPRVVIQPDIYPGNCWAFRGSQGYLVVRLSMAVRPTAFTLEHIPKTLSPTGNITSAPKDFTVYGLDSEYQEEGQLLGQFTYQEAGESLQMFPAQKRPDKAFQVVELRITSNWGHPEYTCLYRFRVHGEPAQ
ncbi:SUN domain-containing protein 1 isoform X2 [Erinaceus europaeus]|uniref:SUN domain-containing protein 1 isoform X2 n=1 Tax=Erinaceus europaeus TaxID=9365 RepID=A0ABM3VXU9_ERIEU|nr:SUN domain-containing protein 1 isoform X2 [Erinaceus europaeus]